MYWSLLNKVTGFRPAILLKKRFQYWWFPVKFEKFLRKPFFTEHLQWLLLFLIAVLFPTIFDKIL